MTVDKQASSENQVFTVGDERISELLRHVQAIGDLSSLRSLAEWDQLTAMPDGGAEVRGHQQATLEGMIHQRQTDSRVGELLQSLEGVVGQPRFTESDRGLVMQVRRGYERATKLPRALVEEKARVDVASSESWEKARAHNDFASFAPWLQRTLELNREIADRIGYLEKRYDALVDDYDPGMTTAQLEKLFVPLRDASVNLLRRIQASGQTPDTSCIEGNFPIEQQKTLCENAAQGMGYDLARGQIAISAHPFTSSFGAPDDVRFTVRYNEKYMAQSLMAALHEGGHALYEQGFAPGLVRTPLAAGASFGLHESQSRLWENVLGRSLPFWQGKYALVQEVFPQQFKEVDVASFVKALNTVEPSLIRVEADEVTYNLHIIIRFELEKALIAGEISVESLPRLWKEKYREYLGIVPENDTLGVLQDSHWSSGFGYFPSYSLGNLASAQIYAKMRSEISDIDTRLAAGDTASILTWLREHMYTLGATYLPEDLLQRLTGEALNPQYFVNYLTEKYEQLYALA